MKKIIDNLKANKFNETYEMIDSKNTGMTYVTKDNIHVKDTMTTSGSITMSKLKSPFNATVIELLEKANCANLAKVALDELGMGGTGEFSFKGPVLNPFNKDLQPGGSSSGSAAAMVSGIDFALGSDTGDSIRIPGQFVKQIGFKPSYGAVSRFGLAPYAQSLDCVSTFAKDFDTLKKVQEIITQKDPKDLTSIDIKRTSLKSLKDAKVLILVDPIKNAEKEFKEDFDKVLKVLEKNGIEPNALTLEDDVYKAVSATYLLIANTEAVQAHLAIDGIKYGDKKNIGSDLRTQLGRNVLRRYAFISDKLFNDKDMIIKAYKFRRHIANVYNEQLEDYDFIITLNAGEKTNKVNESFKTIYDSHLQIANMAGIPSITFPLVDHGDYASAVNICANRGEDFKLIDFASLLGGEL